MTRPSVGISYEKGPDAAADGSLQRPPGPPKLPGQRRRGMLALAVLLVGLGALGAVFVVTSLTHRVSVVVLTKDVPIGTPIGAADLGTSMVSVDPAVRTIPGRQLREVVGKVAGVDLRRGTLLSPSQLTTALSPGQGQQVVPVALQPSQLPARGLNPGDQVLAVVTQGSQGQQPAQASSKSRQQSPDTPATVDRVGEPDADGKVVVDLLVNADVGPAIARQAAAGRIALVIAARRP